ncbi:MAG TPA: extracellular solute-binding protein [Candidatus Paceibacterota bacterium]|nr:extracellular solute-binding protein [Candidatus Paceibacterota bacterium]
MTKFQIILLGIFVLFIVAGVVSFAMYKGNTSTSTTLPAITVWGTFSSSIFNDYVSNINNTATTPLAITYKQIDPSAFSQQFIAALARGTGPDAILISSDMLLPHEDKIAVIPYSAFPARTFMDTYIQEAQLYTTDTGILALPFTIDPLIMYWNRDMYNTAGIATYPRYWDEFNTIIPKLTVKDSNGNIRKSAIALGDFTNVLSSREILGSLFMQMGNPVTTYNAQGALQTTLRISASVNPKLALDFFSQFIDPTNSNYSWNRGMPDSRTAFLAGNLATYFGFASEIKGIRSKNENLNFDAAPLPQIRKGGIKATYGKMFGFSIVRTSANANGTYQVLSALTNPTYLATLAKNMYLPPVRTDLIAQGSSDPYLSVFGEAALVSKSWLDPDPVQTAQLFGNMVESITTGKKSSYQAIEDTGQQFDALIRQATSQ